MTSHGIRARVPLVRHVSDPRSVIAILAVACGRDVDDPVYVGLHLHSISPREALPHYAVEDHSESRRVYSHREEDGQFNLLSSQWPPVSRRSDISVQWQDIYIRDTEVSFPTQAWSSFPTLAIPIWAMNRLTFQGFHLLNVDTAVQAIPDDSHLRINFNFDSNLLSSAEAVVVLTFTYDSGPADAQSGESTWEHFQICLKAVLDGSASGKGFKDLFVGVVINGSLDAEEPASSTVMMPWMYEESHMTFGDQERCVRLSISPVEVWRVPWPEQEVLDIEISGSIYMALARTYHEGLVLRQGAVSDTGKPTFLLTLSRGSRSLISRSAPVPRGHMHPPQ